MSEMINFLKNKWALLLLVGVALVLILIKVFWLPKQQAGLFPSASPQQTLPLPKFIPEQITNQSVNFELGPLSLTNQPTTLPVYQVSSIGEDYFPEASGNLEGQTILFDNATAIEEAKKILKEKGLEINNSATHVSYKTVENLNAFSVPTASEASIFVVDFQLKKDGFPIVLEQPHASIYSVWLGKNGKMQKGFAFKPVLGEAANFPMRSLEQAKTDITKQKGTVVWLEQQLTEEGAPGPLTIDKITLDTVYLAYLLPSQAPGYLQPIYVFEGKASLVDGSSVAAAVYLPAVEEKYLGL
jgi:hypothetical protein